MPRHLFLLRHAEAENKAPGMRDFDRMLTPRGQQQCTSLSKQLSAMSFRPDAIFTSKATRAMETTKRVMNYLQDSITAEEEEVIYTADEVDMARFVRRVDDEFGSIVIVGHNPTLSGLATDLHPDFKTGLDTCEMVWLEFSTGTWREVSAQNSQLKKYFRNH